MISQLLILSYHHGAGGYVLVNEKLPNYVVPDLTDFKVLIYIDNSDIVVSKWT